MLGPMTHVSWEVRAVATQNALDGTRFIGWTCDTKLLDPAMVSFAKLTVHWLYLGRFLSIV